MNDTSPTFEVMAPIIYADIAVTAMSVLAFILLMTLLPNDETPTKPYQEHKKSFLSLAMLLRIMSVSHIGAAACEVAMNYSVTFSPFNVVQRAIINVVQDFMTSTFQLAYLLYIWSRGCTVMKIKAKKIIPVMDAFVRFVPFFLYLQTIPDLILATNSSAWISSDLESNLEITGFALTAITAFLIIAFDFILLGSFISFLRDANKVSATLKDPRLTIISQYGMASCLCGLSVVVIFVVSILFSDTFSNQLASVFVYVAVFGVFSAVVLMKVALLRGRMEKGASGSANSSAPRTAGHTVKTSTV
ncbi:hypothetical protein BC830DRAFT_1112920 [Chytriomyces sp. MP71]|nr:hypothetical protein BC830DRAFT_1112920 [Chytriomyces sp. MP71]